MVTKHVLAELVAGRRLSVDGADTAFEAIFSGEADEAQIAAMLAMIQARGPCVDEVVGAARAMRRHVLRVPAKSTEGLIDTCGTGGAPKTFNISTAAAFVAAGAEPPAGRPRARVAKHGNRSRTGRGSAEVLEQLGVNVAASVDVQARCLDEAGCCFSFAIHHHPATKHAVAPRKSLGFPTLFNLLGPLTNPAGARRQLVGVYAPGLVELEAGALAALGAERAVVVHGSDGLDEITTTGPTIVAHVENGSIRTGTIDPEALGIAPASLDDLRATTLEEAADAVRSILAGESGAKRDITELNAAAALLVAGTVDVLEEGLTLARISIDSGAAQAALDRLIETSRG